MSLCVAGVLALATLACRSHSPMELGSGITATGDRKGTPRAAGAYYNPNLFPSPPEDFIADGNVPLSAAGTAEALTAAVSEAEISMLFHGEHIADIADFISTFLAVNIVVDTRVVVPKQAPREPELLPGWVIVPSDVFPNHPVWKGTPEQPYPPEESVTDPAATENPPGPEQGYVSMDVTDMPLHEALDTLLEPLGLIYCHEPGYIWISSPDLIAQECGRSPRQRYEAVEAGLPSIAHALQEPLTLEFEDEHLSDVAEYLSIVAKINIALDFRVVPPKIVYVPAGVVPPESAEEESALKPPYVTDGIVAYVNLTDLKLRETLTALLRPLSLDFSIEEGYIWISSPEQIREDGMRFGLRAAELDSIPSLQRPVALTFRAEPLPAILAQLSDAWDVKIVLDSVGYDRARKDAAAQMGVPIETLIVSEIRLNEGIAMVDALSALLRLSSMTFDVRDDTIYVSTPERVREAGFDSWVGV